MLVFDHDHDHDFAGDMECPLSVKSQLKIQSVAIREICGFPLSATQDPLCLFIPNSVIGACRRPLITDN